MAPDFDVPEYSQQPDGWSMVQWCRLYLGEELLRQEIGPGDAVVVATDIYPQHLGLLGDYRHGGLSIIHASNALSVQPPRVIETRLMFSRNMRFVAGFTFPGVPKWVK